MQRYTVYFIWKLSTCLEWYHHPSSGGQTTVSRASGIRQTVTATCGWRQVAVTVWQNTRCSRYSCLRSWWWVVIPLETCRAVSRLNKLCNVASCWIYIVCFVCIVCFVSFCVLFVCICVLYYCHRVATELLLYISYILEYAFDARTHKLQIN